MPLLPLLLGALLLGPLVADAAEPRAGAGPTREELFKWGEYDSLIRETESWLAMQRSGGAEPGDSSELARANLQLGVAYWATGRKPLGDQAFIRACRLDTALILDRLYATPEIVRRFEEIAASERQSLRWLKPRPGILPASRPPRRESAWKWWTAGAMAMAGASWGAWHYYVSTLPPVHRDRVTVIDGRDPLPPADFP